MRKCGMAGWLVLALAAAIGCQPAQQKPSPRPSMIPDPAPSPTPPGPPSSVVDPCAEQLHELSGALLMYYLLNNRLPDRLEELRKFADNDRPTLLICPSSGRPYEYTRQGFAVPPWPGSVIIHDAQPAHQGGRWAILVQPPGEGPLVTQVIAIPESLFAAALKAAARPAP